MSAVGLPLHWRVQVKNESGSSGAVVGSYRGVKLSTDGALSYGSTGSMTGLFGSSTVANNGFLNSSQQDNASDKYLGADFDFNFISTGGGSGSFTVYFQSGLSTGDFPGNGSGTPVLVVSSTNWAAESTSGLDRSVEV